MKLHLSTQASENLFTGYGEGFIAVNQRHIETNVVVLPDKLIEPWPVTSFEALTETDFAFFTGLNVEVVLLGTGKQIRFPHPRLAKSLHSAKIGLEVMDTPAACRTYNILMAEGRKIAAAIFVL